MAELIGIGKVDTKNLPRIVIIGTGLIGSIVAENFNVKPLSHKAGEVDVVDRDFTLELLGRIPKGSIVINASGATRVDAIEDERTLGINSPSYQLNVIGTRNVAEACLQNGLYMVQFSSETAFGRGEKGKIILETDIPPWDMPADQRSFYGTTKAHALAVMRNYFYVENGNGLVIGIQYPSDKNVGYFAKAIKFPGLVDDCDITPSLVSEIAPIVAQAYVLGITRVILNAVGTPTTPYDFVTAGKKRMGIIAEVPRTKYADLKGKTVRAQYSLMSRKDTETILRGRLRTSDEQLVYLTS